MEILVDISTAEELSLEDFLAAVRSQRDWADEDAILELAPRLLALARNRHFLADWLDQRLREGELTTEAAVYASAFILVKDPGGFMVRVVGWPPLDGQGFTPGGRSTHGYHRRHGMLHTHDFHLLTVGYAGSGYETEVFELTAGCDQAVGEKVPLRSLGTYRLSEGTVLFYPAHRVAHVQRPPQEYSVSLNLIVRPKARGQQVFIDQESATVIERVSFAEAVQSHMVTLAGMLADSRFIPALQRISEHPSAIVRRAAGDALQRCETAQSQPGATEASSDR